MKPPFPPYYHYSGFLSAEDESLLLAWALANEKRFSPSTLAGGIIDPQQRKSRRLLDLGPIRESFEAKIHSHSSDFFSKTGTAPFEIEYLELEIAAHGDGAHFGAHTDIPIGAGRAPLGGDRSGTQDRILSAVYYFHREPKSFTGGQLRLHRLCTNGEPGNHVDIEPEGNSLLIFPSWAAHEVRAVQCPSSRFEDNRFSVNCWLCKTLE